jgi:uncharacterized protein (TIGR04255 family)
MRRSAGSYTRARMVQDAHPHLDRAPITEAILDIAVETDAKLAATEAFARKVAGAYPDSSPVVSVEAFFSVTPGQSGMAGSQSSPVGRICWNSAKTRAVQARVNGFTVNHVGSYESWDVLRAQARDLWEEYVELVPPKKVSRLALRYINRLTLPVAGDLGQYMQTYPALGPTLPNEMRNLFMRVEVPFTTNRMAIITQTVLPKDPGAAERDLILDVDAVSLTEFGPKDADMWHELDELREIKNRCFFGSLQGATWRKYQ